MNLYTKIQPHLVLGQEIYVKILFQVYKQYCKNCVVISEKDFKVFCFTSLV